MWWVIAVAILFLGAAFVTLRAAEQVSTPRAAHPSPPPAGHPPPSAPEESATITDDPTTAPDAAQSADNNVSFPNDI
jgi:hypothetical protein